MAARCGFPSKPPTCPSTQHELRKRLVPRRGAVLGLKNGPEVTTMGAATTYRSETLQVPGASLYYELRGWGPVLLMMRAGPADATTFRPLESDLASRYTVVTYDPRGLSHSKLEGPLDDSRMVQIFAVDVHRLLAKLTDAKACVFASSGGAVIALELAVRHPEQLATVNAHEPPAPGLVPNSVHVRAAMEDVCDTHATEGL